MDNAFPTHVTLDQPAERAIVADDFAQLNAIFGLMPKIIFHVKDRTRRWVSCNRAALNLLRYNDFSDVIGLREEDFFPRAVAEAIKKDDLRVLEHGEHILERIEIIADPHGELVWVETSKIPVLTPEQEVIGLVGITQWLDDNHKLPPRFEKFRAAVDMIDSADARTPTIPELAVSANMSESHFRRSFKQCFKMSPQEFILQNRLRRAAKLLTQSDLSIAIVAMDCGFADQSHFSRQFGRFFGETPRRYRDHWR